MEITHLGHSSFKIRGKTGTLVTDPYNPEMVGLKFPKVEADIVTISHSHQDHNCTSVVSGNPLIISGPGEYEVKGVKILGIATFHDNSNGVDRGKNTIYRIDMDKVVLLHLGDLGHILSDRILEILDEVDVLMVPVGGVVTIDFHQAAEVVSKVEPKIVLPMHYQKSGLNQKIFSHLASIEMFLKEMGKEQLTPVPKLTISKDKLPLERTVVVLE